jgi:preprotein translocase subunit SecG
MSIFIGFLYVVEVVVCILLGMVVMIQKPKEGGLGGAIGGGMMEAALGADAGNVLIRTTAILGAIFLLNTLVLARLTSTVHSRSLMARESEPVAETAPVVPEAPALPETPELPAAPAAEVPAAPAPAAPAAPAPAAPAAPAPAAPAPEAK